MQTVETETPAAIIVVVLREVLVAQDIEAILRDAMPQARVILATTLDEAIAALFEMPSAARVAAAFVQLDPAEVAKSDLGKRVAADGGRMVLLAPETPETLPLGWSGMAFPFAETDVVAQLSGGHRISDDDGEAMAPPLP